MRLILARHGETPANVTGTLDTHLPGPDLTELGVAQADGLADALAGEPLAAVYASRALRARRTAAPVAARHGLDVRVLDGVHEVVVGELQGRSDQAAQRTFFDTFDGWLAGDRERSMPGGESAEQVLARFRAGVRTIVGEHPTGTVLLVAHGAVIRLGASTLAANVAPAQILGNRVPNTGRVELLGGPTDWRCTSWPGVPPEQLTG